jgi:hypothetical protein
MGHWRRNSGERCPLHFHPENDRDVRIFGITIATTPRPSETKTTNFSKQFWGKVKISQLSTRTSEVDVSDENKRFELQYVY